MLLIAALFGASALAQTVEFRPGFSGCVDVVVTAAAPFDGAELAWQYAGLQAPSVVAGPDLPAGAFLAVNLQPLSSCTTARPGVAVGLVVGTTPLPAGTHRLLEVCHPLPGTVTALCFSIDFVDCIGNPPILNRLFPGSVDLAEVDGQVCFLELPFRRGDLDGDGAQTVGDAVAILHCLFLQARCPGCLDVADSNDDGFADISDVVFLLSWRVGLIPQLPLPSTACGEDTTPDQFLCPDRGGEACAWAELRWNPPVTDARGDPLDGPVRHRLYVGEQPGSYSAVIDVGAARSVFWPAPDGTRGRRYFAVAAYDQYGESELSNEAWKEF